MKTSRQLPQWPLVLILLLLSAACKKNNPSVTPVPTISSISPVSGSAGTKVTINGANFKTTTTGNTVQFNGLAATVQTATATALTVLAPASGVTGAVTVTISDGTATGPVFTYVAATDVYVVGTSIYGRSYWKNGVMVDLTTTTAGPLVYESAMAIAGSGSDVYIAGNGVSLGVGYWKNGVFVSLPGADQVNGIFVK